MMPAARLSSRIDILETKTQIEKRIGHAKADIYFDLLTRFLSLRIGKIEFDKLCILTIGKENVRLHNHLLRSILKNGFLAKEPPSSKRSCEALENGYQTRCLQQLLKDLPQSPRRVRTPSLRDRRYKDRPSPLGPNGRNSSADCEDTMSVILEQPSHRNLHCLVSSTAVPAARNDQEEANLLYASPSTHQSPIRAPLAIPEYTKQRSNISLSRSCCSNGELPDSNVLMKMLEHKLQREGLSISMDYANLLNNALDVYLKRLVKPCLELTSSKSAHNLIDPTKCPVSLGFNGMPMRYFPDSSATHSVSYSDFRAVMEMNPLILGGSWSVELEKVCLHTPEI